MLDEGNVSEHLCGLLAEGLQWHSGVSQGRVCSVALMSTEPDFSRFWFYSRGIKTSEQPRSV